MSSTAEPVARADAPIATVLIPHRRLALSPEPTMHCVRCGITIHPASFQHDRTLLLASCCPRCDGQLIPYDARPSDREATPWADTAPATD